MYGDSLELLDVSSQLPELKRRPGLTKWLIQDKKRWYANYGQVLPISMSRLTPTMFPIPDAPPGAATERQVLVDTELPEGDATTVEGKAVHEGGSLEGALKEAEATEGGQAVDSTETEAGGTDVGGTDGGENVGGGIGKGRGHWHEQVIPKAEESGLPLHRSMRVVPHDQDTGGFFVAVFRKLKHLEGEESYACVHLES